MQKCIDELRKQKLRQEAASGKAAGIGTAALSGVPQICRQTADRGNRGVRFYILDVWGCWRYNHTVPHP